MVYIISVSEALLSEEKIYMLTKKTMKLENDNQNNVYIYMMISFSLIDFINVLLTYVCINIFPSLSFPSPKLTNGEQKVVVTVEYRQSLLFHLVIE